MKPLHLAMTAKGRCERCGRRGHGLQLCPTRFTHLLATALLFVACGYPESRNSDPVCEQDDVEFGLKPSDSQCFWLRHDVLNFRDVFKNKPGFDIEKTRGHHMTVTQTDGGWEGLTRCDLDESWLATYNDPQVVIEELAHKAEGCPCVSLPNGNKDCHINWTERGVYEDIYKAANGPLFPPLQQPLTTGASGGNR